ncbi:ABC transporter permease [Salinarimonas ramus]|uniref:ABC transporter n=1 Tax=Salinarimonas ramus TaxID=690164 RepID=A0A917Q5Z6_9HYPH|nr:ABC transporter permease [Salinarimonas ramus]GGK28115.1 ABC transporter [Salinarimonas ramus]
MSAGLVVRAIALAILLAFLVAPEAFTPVFAPLTERGAPAIYTQADMLALAMNHLGLVAAAVVAATIVSVGLAIVVTRPFGAEFLPLSRSIANIGQTFPPIAVLALAVPALGFGAAPTFVALFLYGLLPIFENALTGLTNVQPAVREAATGMGMTQRQRLVQVELPLALPVILAGIRLSTVIALATATIGSTVAASTLGEVIIAGLLTNNVAYILQGGLVVGALAVLIYDAFLWLERALARRMGRTA